MAEPQINNYGGMAVASFSTSVASNYMQLQSSLDQSDALEIQASRYKFKASRSKLAAESARTQTKLNNTIMQEQFNETQSLQAVQFAMQGRSGATVANIIAQDQEQLNWDKEFMRLSGIIEATGYELDAQGYLQDAAAQEIAASETTRGGYRSAGIGLLNSGFSAASLL